MIAFACGLQVVACSWFGFNSMIFTHFFELTFEFAHTPIVKNNKLRSRITCQPGVMEQILDGCFLLFVALTVSNQPVVGSIIVNTSKLQRVCFGWCPYCKCTNQIHTAPSLIGPSSIIIVKAYTSDPFIKTDYSNITTCK
jgi:hypothetical protein